MRRNLVLLILTLATLAAALGLAPIPAARATVSPATLARSAANCPKGSHLIDCTTYTFCCPDNAFCVCGP